MTYMTVQQAAEVWGVTVRQVQSYCTRGRAPGGTLPLRNTFISAGRQGSTLPARIGTPGFPPA